MGASAELVEDYGDYFFRGYDIPEKSKNNVEKLRKNDQAHNLIKRFMECCAQIQKCNLDNKAFNENKNKYSNQKKNQAQEQTSNDTGLVQENAWLNQKI